ncbi:polyketide cyclase [Actinacidiphila alni]|uniref:polyketide cyclase n=1 Tax=Actinacidiphila alni TaxID=380248 RepID=UPI003408315F
MDTVEQETISATLTVHAPAEKVFAVLADPGTHAAIDGTGWVRRPVDPAPLTGQGQVFRMAMHNPGHPDGDYETANKVHVLAPPLAIGWMTGQERGEGEGDYAFGGWCWRYDLAPAGEDTTEVTLTYDWSAVPQEVRDGLPFPFPPFGPDHLPNSLRHLAELLKG